MISEQEFKAIKEKCESLHMELVKERERRPTRIVCAKIDALRKEGQRIAGAIIGQRVKFARNKYTVVTGEVVKAFYMGGVVVELDHTGGHTAWAPLHEIMLLP